jgi:hypothetical protein
MCTTLIGIDSIMHFCSIFMINYIMFIGFTRALQFVVPCNLHIQFYFIFKSLELKNYLKILNECYILRQDSFIIQMS